MPITEEDLANIQRDNPQLYAELVQLMADENAVVSDLAKRVYLTIIKPRMGA